MRYYRNELLGKLARLQWLMGRFFHYKHRQHGPMGDVHRGQGRILALLKLKPEISQRELSQILDMRPQSLGEFLTKLERNGYITRTPSEEDHRVMMIKLTAEGEAVFAEHESDAGEDDMFSDLTKEEQDILCGYLDRVIGSLERRFAEDGMGTEPDFEERPPFGERGGHRHFGMGGPHSHDAPPFRGGGQRGFHPEEE